MLALWIASNPAWRAALRLDVAEMRPALKWGALVGVALGAVNLSLILLIIPALGGNHRNAVFLNIFGFRIDVIDDPMVKDAARRIGVIDD